jgi:hypothetical protein
VITHIDTLTLGMNPWKSDRLVAEVPTYSTQHSQETMAMPPARFFFSFCFLSFYLVLCSCFFRTSFFVLTVLVCSFVFTVQHTTQTSMRAARFEPLIPASERPFGSAFRHIRKYTVLYAHEESTAFPALIFTKLT